MSGFAFIFHYSNVDDIINGLKEHRQGPRLLANCLKLVSPRLVKWLAFLLPPYKWFEVSKSSASSVATKGFVLVCPFFPEQVSIMGERAILNKLVKAGRTAERLGAQIIGLAGFCSIVGNEGEQLSKVLKVPVTSGNTYTAALVVEGIHKAAELMGVELSSTTMAVIGATGDIGSACARVFVKEVKRLHLAARNEPRLEEFGRSLRGKAAVAVKKYVKDAIRDADIILTATSAVTTLIEPDDVKSGAIVCDVAIPHNVAKHIVRSRNDVLAFEGGLSKAPFSLKASDQRWLKWISPDGETIFGCLGETMLLSLESRWESFSIGRGNITPERISEISQLALRHGFSLADFRYDDKVFSEKEIRSIREHAKSRLAQEEGLEPTRPIIQTA